MLVATYFMHIVFAVTTGGAHALSVDLASAIKIPVEKYQLANGLTVLLHADPTVPVVNVQTWYKVGSKDEVPGRTGIAHFFEHMMFKGTPRFGHRHLGDHAEERRIQLQRRHQPRLHQLLHHRAE